MIVRTLRMFYRKTDSKSKIVAVKKWNHSENMQTEVERKQTDENQASVGSNKKRGQRYFYEGGGGYVRNTLTKSQLTLWRKRGVEPLNSYSVSSRSVCFPVITRQGKHIHALCQIIMMSHRIPDLVTFCKSVRETDWCDKDPPTAAVPSCLPISELSK